MPAHRIILASSSEIRLRMMRNAALVAESHPARIDEEALKLALELDGQAPRDMADHLADAKARKVSSKYPDALTLGCDQVLEFERKVLNKPTTPSEAEHQIAKLSGKSHQLHSAVVLYENGQATWRHVSTAKIYMRRLSENFIRNYVSDNWPGLSYTVGGYKFEEQGVRLIHRTEGDYFTILGLPLMELVSHLTLRGVINS